jgi:ABC-type transport system involved in multi-copper enzyme maturation permease subunit
MPYLAILQYELHTLYKSRLVRLWAIASGVLTLVLATSNWANFQDAPMIATLLFPFLVLPWFVIVMVLGVTPLSGSNAETLAQSILCRPLTRYEYLLAVWSARTVAVLGIYLVVIVPAVLLVVFAKRPVAEDTVTLYGIASSLAVVGLVLLFQLSLGFLMGTLLRKSLLSVVILIFIWAPINFVLDRYSLEEFSPYSLSQAIPVQLRQPWHTSPDDAKNNTPQVTLTEPEPKKKTDKPGFFESEKFDDISLGRVIAGYGLLTLFAVSLAILCFWRRDL